MATFLKDDQNKLVRDQNRYRKIYRYIRKKPRPLVCEGSNISHFTWGAYMVEFNYENSVEHIFPCCYSTIPAVIATTVAKSSTGGAGEAAKVSLMVFGEDVTSDGYNFTTTKVGVIDAAKRDDIEREWIDLKNKDGTTHRIKFSDGVSASPDNAPHPSYLRAGTPTQTTTVDISGVNHWGLDTTIYSSGTASSVTFTFQHPTGESPSTHLDSSYSLNSNVYGSNKLSDLLQNLWWDFRNNALDSNSIWRIVISGGGDYPADHAINNPGRPSTVTRTPNKTFTISPSGSTLGDWLTSFKNLLSTTTVDGSKFTDKWNITTTNGSSGSAGATLTFTSKTGNKGALADLANPAPTMPKWYDSYNKAKDAVDDKDIIATQTASTSGTGTETATNNIGLVSKIVSTVNDDSNFNSKWTATASENSIERIAGSDHYETFVLTFTATESNKGLIGNLSDSGNEDPDNFYYHFGDWLAKNNPSPAVSPGAHFFSLTATGQYRHEKYADGTNAPDPTPILTTNGTNTGGRPVPGDNPNYNVFVTDITTSGCKFRTSGNFTGYVYYQALLDGAYNMPNIGKSLEVKTLSFDGTADYFTYTFTVNDNAGFTCDPIVTVTADEDVNAFVTALSKTSVTVEVSKAGYQGKVYLQAIEKGC